jgi:hypothetical protein
MERRHLAGIMAAGVPPAPPAFRRPGSECPALQLSSGEPAIVANARRKAFLVLLFLFFLSCFLFAPWRLCVNIYFAPSSLDLKIEDRLAQ